MVERICSGQTLRWSWMIPDSWCSHPYVIPTPWMWVGPVTCFYETEYDKGNRMLLKVRLHKVATSILLADSISFRLACFDIASGHVGDVHMGRNWGQPWANVSLELKPSIQQPTKRKNKWIIPQSNVQKRPQVRMAPYLKPYERHRSRGPS